MTLEKEFEENRNFFNSNQSSQIDRDGYKKFVQQYGTDIEKGYQMAVNDLLPKVEEVMLELSHAKMRKKALELFECMKEVLHLDSNLDKQSNSNANVTPFKPI